MTDAPFGRMLTAMVTPFTRDGALDLAAAAELAADLVDLGNDGLVISGTTGESPTTTDAEKDALLREVLAAVGDRATIVAGVGSNDTAHTIELARAAERAGAAGLLVVTPYYSKPPQAGLLRHFRAVADATDSPIMLYDIPGRTGVPLAHETLVSLAEHPRIVANKDAKADPFAAVRVMAETDLAWYSGDDALNLPLLAMGAVGMVSVIGHVAADRLAAMHAAFRAGDVVTAASINSSLTPVVEGIMTRTQGVIMVKAALDLLQRPGGGSLRLPLVEADAEQRDRLRQDLKAGGFEL
ncbi:MAG: 4-hydroxy-tetrahydrodipicolinate synthase [Candidatus Nanopelagicales bacterium]